MIDRDQIRNTAMAYFRKSTLSGPTELEPKHVVVLDDGMVTFNITVKLSRQVDRLPVNIKHINGSFLVFDNKIQTLEGFPESLKLGLQIRNCRNLTSLAHAPLKCQSARIQGNCPISDLSDIVTKVGSYDNGLEIVYHRDLPLLKLCIAPKNKLILSYSMPNPDNPKLVIGAPAEVLAIMSRYAYTGRDSILACAAELHKAGFGSNAKL